MVALRGQWLGPHPVTGVNGLWYQRTGDPDGFYLGFTKAELLAFPQGNGSLATRTATYLANAKSSIEDLLGTGRYSVTITLPIAGGFDIDNIEIRDA